MPQSYAQRVYTVAGASDPTVDAVAVDDTATLILAASAGDRTTVSLNNAAAGGTVYLGPDNTVTTSTGFPLAAGETIQWPSQGAIYGICATAGSTTVTVIEFTA